jgi:hypothetical protein
MTIRSVCLLGSSHTGAIKQAWSNRCEAGTVDWSVTFFAARGGQMQGLQCANGVVAPDTEEVRIMFERTSGGHSQVILERYDAVVIYAIGLAFQTILTLSAEWGTVAHLQQGTEGCLVSSACFAALVRDCVVRSGAIRLLEQIRATYSRPVVVCITPLPPYGLFDETRCYRPSRFSNPDYLTDLYEQFRATVDSECEARGGAVVWQDECTIHPPCFTKAEFSFGSPSNGGKIREAYTKHMNEDFGAIMLESIFRRLEQIAPRRTAEIDLDITRPKVSGGGSEWAA